MLFVFEIEDQPIIISLYQRKYYHYYAMALYITRNTQIAPDVVQNSFADFIEEFDNHRQMQEEEMERYIMAMVRNQAKKKERTCPLEFSITKKPNLCTSSAKKSI